jgi:hypothetical protein
MAPQSKSIVPPAAQKGEAQQALGISLDGRTWKIHALVDAKGRPLRVIVTDGKVYDSKVARTFFEYV